MSLRNRALQTALSSALLLVVVAISGCTSISRRETVSPSCFTNGLHGGPRSELEPINLVRLRQDPPNIYMLDQATPWASTSKESWDLAMNHRLSISPSAFNVIFPPAIGYPIPIREDGTLPLPLIPAIMADGLTIPQLEMVIRRSYIDNEILVRGRDRIIVTLMRPRTYKVLVIREDVQTQRRGITRGVDWRVCAWRRRLDQRRLSS